MGEKPEYVPSGKIKPSAESNAPREKLCRDALSASIAVISSSVISGISRNEGINVTLDLGLGFSGLFSQLKKASRVVQKNNKIIILFEIFCKRFFDCLKE